MPADSILSSAWDSVFVGINNFNSIVMGKMKQVAALASNGPEIVRAHIGQFKRAIKSAKDNNINYVIVQGELWTIEQAQGVISLLTQTLTQDDTLHREPSSTSDS